jgi:3-phenylpropionate/trans-cinnamate dioxygenase ferredoxin reductase subunit/benzoate/toluate 1,2-dioxygenase reductase subunit
MSVRVTIRAGCTGMGSCARLAPEVFRFAPGATQPTVLVADAEPWREAVLAAAQSCPFVAAEIDGVPSDEPTEPVTVAEVRRLTPSVVELTLLRPGFRFVPGQYAFVGFTDSEGAFFRPYSLVSAEGGRVVFTIRQVTHGRAGQVLPSLVPGTRLAVSRAAGAFALLTPDRPKLFLASGTGLAPIMPMLRAAPQADKVVVFGGRNEADFFYLDELRAIPRTEVILIAANPGPQWQGRTGLVPQLIDDLELTRFHELYVAGSPTLVATVRARALARGFPAAQIRSDAFDPRGPTAANVTSGVPTPVPRRTRDWPGLLRRVHFSASLMLALVFLFYAVTGFIANRSAWFTAPETPTTAAATPLLPPSVSADQAGLVPWAVAQLPATAVLAKVEETAQRTVCSFTVGDLRERFDLNRSTRAVRRETVELLPAGLALTRAALLAHFTSRLGGDADLPNLEDDDERFAVELESVWGTRSVVVDKSARSARITVTRPDLVVSLVDLHRSKHAGGFQRVVVDLTAIALTGLVLSGIAMGLVAARRRLALILVGLSLLPLLFLLTAR